MFDSIFPLLGALAVTGAIWYMWWFIGSNRPRHPDVANSEIDRVRYRMLMTVGAIVAVIAGVYLFG